MDGLDVRQQGNTTCAYSIGTVQMPWKSVEGDMRQAGNPVKRGQRSA